MRITINISLRIDLSSIAIHTDFKNPSYSQIVTRTPHMPPRQKEDLTKRKLICSCIYVATTDRSSFLSYPKSKEPISHRHEAQQHTRLSDPFAI